MKKIICLVAINFLILFVSQVVAKELLVVSGETSQTSKRWKEEVLPEYPNSEAGKNLPAKIVAVQGENFPEWLAKAMEVGRVGEIIGTPTFIIWDDGNKKEVGRVEGYTQKLKFYSQLSEAMMMVDRGEHPGRREGSGGHEREEGSGGHDEREEGSGGDQRQEGSDGEQPGGGSEMSRDIMDHMYKTPEEAKRASEMLGFGGEIHTHESPEGTIYMPGPMM
ncbi:MAG: hypothetical protein O3A78_10295 [Nitrospinae bacterium]|jgi:hypothetical protein|nr:hypothetical protein [Nitrospinota bacterium]MDA1110178.1 hypothetical protein [Nitrospinota bacterium]